MKITSITVSNFLGLPHFEHALSSPVLFVAAPNGSGKSSLLQAVRFALTNVMPRGITKAGDRAQLITEGARQGFVEVVADGGAVRRTVGTAKLTGELPENTYLDLCLDAPQFAKLPDADRRKLLFAISGVRANGETVAEQLRAQRVPDDVILEVVPRLRAGFETAAAYARDRATQARGAWRAVTGEAYGAVKAETWSANGVPAPEAQEIANHEAEIAALSARIPALHEAIGRVEAAIPAEKLAELETLADTVHLARESLDLAEAEYRDAERRVRDLESAARGHVPTTMACPCCGMALALRGGVLEKAEEASDDKSHVSKADLDAAKVAAHDIYTKLQTCRAGVAECQAAKSTLASLPLSPSEDDYKAAELLLSVQSLLADHRSKLAELQHDQQINDEAARKTKEAASHHAIAVGWKAAEDALAPEGIPSILLAKALDPINTVLSDMAKAAGWRPAAVTRDIALTYGGRAYNLVSESEQWRADAMFSAAIAAMTHTRLLVLDRFDVLDPVSRADALDWLDWLVSDGHIDTAIVAGTLKAEPDLGETVDVVWLGGA